MISLLATANPLLPSDPLFYPVVGGVVLANILVWLVDFSRGARKVYCRQCGEERLPTIHECPACGAAAVRIPLLNRLAIGTVVLGFGGMGVALLFMAVASWQAGEGREALQALSTALSMLLLAGAVMVAAFSVKRIGWLWKALGQQPTGQLELQVNRLRHDPKLALRVMVLVLSIGAIALVIWHGIKSSGDP